MKILYLCPEFIPKVGGIISHVHNIASRMKALYGHEVVIYTFDQTRRSIAHTAVNGLEVRNLRSLAPSRCYYFSPELMLNLQREVKRSSCDLIHVHSYTNFGPLAACILKEFDLKETRVVFTPHYHPKSTTQAREVLRKIYDSLLRRKIFNTFDAVIALTSLEKKILSAFCEEQKIHIIPNGVDFEEIDAVPRGLFRHKYALGESQYVLYVGHLQRYKGLDSLLFAIENVMKKTNVNVRIVFVGDGPFKETLKKIVNRLGLRHEVMFTGFLERKFVVSAIKDCDIFIMPSSYEAFSISTLEAMACQRAIIATRSGGVCELGIDDRFMIEYNDVNALSERIIHLLEHRETAELAGWKNYQAARRYSWNLVAEAHHKLYTSMTFSSKE